jgi:hypothetical protein
MANHPAARAKTNFARKRLLLGAAVRRRLIGRRNDRRRDENRRQLSPRVAATAISPSGILFDSGAAMGCSRECTFT